MVVYHDAFLTPGNSARLASSRKHSRHRPKARIYALGRPHIWHRLRYLVGNLSRPGICLTIFDVFATLFNNK
ncbi:hypothetical protein A2379_03295 [Candidatus Amesbacteria bacterium RIFOXYB1_FULL_47_13]|nr:MAG: hypothetical protein A2379_03295 [Candidatus Amesbacteria bacterium RIFOXYB1_FULL_47_13]